MKNIRPKGKKSSIRSKLFHFDPVSTSANVEESGSDSDDFLFVSPPCSKKRKTAACPPSRKGSHIVFCCQFMMVLSTHNKLLRLHLSSAYTPDANSRGPCQIMDLTHLYPPDNKKAGKYTQDAPEYIPPETLGPLVMC